jgi:hypothetical protein
MDVDDDDDDDDEGSFAMDGSQVEDDEETGSLAVPDLAFQEEGFDGFFDVVQDVDTSDLMETYYEALEQQEAERKPRSYSSIRFADQDDALMMDVDGDVTHRSMNLRNSLATEATLDIFDERKQSYSDPRPGYTYEDDEDASSMYEDLFGDETDSDDEEEESEDKKIMRGVFYSLGGVAVFGALGFVARKLLGTIHKSEDVDGGGGTEHLHGMDQSAAAADSAQGVVPAAAEPASGSSNVAFNVSFTSSSSSDSQGAIGGAFSVNTAQGTAATAQYVFAICWFFMFPIS